MILRVINPTLLSRQLAWMGVFGLIESKRGWLEFAHVRTSLELEHLLMFIGLMVGWATRRFRGCQCRRNVHGLGLQSLNCDVETFVCR